MKISIITPNYNYGNYIGQTIESIISQSYRNWEHIIVDDGSTDNSVAVIQKYVLKNSKNIKLFQQENKGQTVAINNALQYVTGDLIGWINSDDTFCEDVFAKIVAAFENHPQADAVFGNFNIMDIESNYIYTKRHLKFNSVESVFIGFGNTLTSNCIFWRKTLSDKINLFDEELKYNMDGEYFSRLVFRANLYLLDIPIANFRKQKISIAGNNNDSWNEIVEKEILHEKKQSYNRLQISKFIPYNIGKYLGLFFLLKRVMQKTIRLDYSLIYRSKRTYKRLFLK